MKWLRLYSDIIDDPKILRLSPEIRWFYVGILAISSRQERGGTLPGVDDIAIHLRVTESKVKKILEILTDAGLIEESHESTRLYVHGWDKRQFPSDNVTERTRKHRGRSDEQPTTPPKERFGNVPGTPQSRADTEQIQNRAEAPLPPEGGHAASPPIEEPEPPEYPDAPTSMFMVMPGEHRLTELQAKELWGDIWRSWRDKKLCFTFYEHQQWCSYASWKHAIKTAIKRGVKPGSIRYLETIGVDADDNGVKSDRPVNRGQIGSVPYVPTTARKPKDENVLASFPQAKPRNPGPAMTEEEAKAILFNRKAAP